jgi:hypothetical protein
MEVSFIAPLYDRPPDFYSKGLFWIWYKKILHQKGHFMGKLEITAETRKETRKFT